MYFVLKLIYINDYLNKNKTIILHYIHICIIDDILEMVQECTRLYLYVFEDLVLVFVLFFWIKFRRRIKLKMEMLSLELCS